MLIIEYEVKRYYKLLVKLLNIFYNFTSYIHIRFYDPYE